MVRGAALRSDAWVIVARAPWPFTGADKEGRAFATCATAYDTVHQLAATVPTQVPTTLRLLLRNATVLPMTGPQTEEEILTNQCIVVQSVWRPTANNVADSK